MTSLSTRLVADGAHVALGACDAATLAAAAEEMHVRRPLPDQQVIWMPVDVSQLAPPRSLSQTPRSGGQGGLQPLSSGNDVVGGGPDTSWLAEFEHFVDCILRGTPVSGSLEDALAVLNIIGSITAAASAIVARSSLRVTPGGAGTG